MFRKIFIPLILGLLLQACGGDDGPPMADKTPKTFGPEGHRVPPFGLYTQGGDTLTHEDLEGKVHVADFFFTTCPTICPKMTKNMRRLQKRLGKLGYSKDEVMLLSITVDPRHDSAEVLREYASEKNADTEQWKFLTGPRDRIYELGQDGYFATASKDSSEPGGYLHSGKFILVDQKRRIRGYYDGTDSTSLDPLIGDMRWLLKRADSSETPS